MAKSKIKPGKTSPASSALDDDVIEEEEELEELDFSDLDGLEESIHDLLKLSTFEPEQRYWLDTGSKALNGTLGSATKGLPYGKVFEIAGHKHGGKTAISTILGGMAQRDGAVVGYMDLENSYDPIWARKLGMRPEGVFLINPKLIKTSSKKNADVVLESAEQMFAEAEAAMKMLYKRGRKKQFWILDSVANIQTEMAITEGTMGRGLRVNIDRAQFLSSVMPKWAGLAANYNVLLLLINQLRSKPMAFGDPYYTPGGNAVPFATSIQARVTRLKGGGKLLQTGRTVGIAAKIVNNKNKAGEGSVQDLSCAFKVRWDKDPAKIEFMSLAQAEAELKGEE